MPATSEARIRANQTNSKLAKGPSSPEGLAISRKNGLKHGLTGSGVVLAEEDVAEVERRTSALMDEYNPQTTVGKALVGKLAIYSVRSERGASQEFAAVASRVRNASEAFDHGRVDRAEDLFDTIAADPRRNLRQLKRTPEGVDRLLEAWRNLKDVLKRSDRPKWTDQDRQTVAHLLGLRPDRAIGTQLDSASAVLLGEPVTFLDKEWGTLDDEARRAWALGRLVEQIDEEVAALEKHRETLNFEVIEIDRIEAPRRAFFDDSRTACLARRYESESSRLFFKTLNELRRVEAEAVDRPAPKPVRQPEPTRPPQPIRTPEPAKVSAPLGSSREKPSPTPLESDPIGFDLFEGLIPPRDGAARGLDGRVIAVGRAAVASR